MAKRKKGKSIKGQTYRASKYYELLSDELKEQQTGKIVKTSLTNQEREMLYEHLSMRTTPICWGIPCDEIMYTKFFTNFIRLVNMPWDSFATTESTYLPDARNEIHTEFITKMDAPYLFMIDSDVLAPPEIINTLLSHKKDIVGGWYKNKSLKTGPHPIVYDYLNETDTQYNWVHREEKGEGLEKVDGMGAGCWLMSRKLAEDLGENPYSMERGGEDLWISKKIMDLGYDMWCDWDMACAHLGVSWV